MSTMPFQETLERLKLLNADYIHSLRTHPNFDGQLKIASQNYVVDQNPPFNLREGANETAEGAIFLTNMGFDGSIENALALLGQPIVLSHGLQDDLPPELQVEVIKLFFLDLLIPLSFMLQISIPREE